jgi:hypothetical protein
MGPANILDSIRWGTPQAYGDAQRIAHHLVVPQRDREPGPFDRPAVALLTGVILHLHDLDTASFPRAVEWMQSPSRSQHDKLEEMLHSANPHVASAARRVLDESERFRATVWDAALAPLAVFLDPTIASHSRTSDLDWHDFLSGRQPISLFLCMQFRDIDRLGVILGALVEALIALLGSPERHPRHRTLLLLDELANLGTLTELERGVSYLQGSGVQLMACVQNLPQLVSLYGPHSPLLASIHTQVHYRPLDRLTSEYLEAMVGPGTVLAQSWGQTRTVSLSDVSRGTSTSLQEVGRPLLTAAELRALPSESALVLASGCAPILARKLGVPQPPLSTRTWRLAMAHREVSATLAAAALVVLALIPALAPVLQSPPLPQTQPVVDQMRVLPASTPPAAVPSTAPDAATPPPPAPADGRQALPVFRKWDEEYARRAADREQEKIRLAPWVLTHTDSARPPAAQRIVEGHYVTQEECRAQLMKFFEPMIIWWDGQKSKANAAIFGPQTSREPDRLTWSFLVSGKRQSHVAWCERHGEEPAPKQAEER